MQFLERDFEIDGQDCEEVYLTKSDMVTCSNIRDHDHKVGTNTLLPWGRELSGENENIDNQDDVVQTAAISHPSCTYRMREAISCFVIVEVQCHMYMYRSCRA